MKQKCDVDRGEDLDSDDLTRDMDDPPSDTNLREVEMPKSGGGGGGQTGAGAAPGQAGGGGGGGGGGGLQTGGSSAGASSNLKKDDWMPTKVCVETETRPLAVRERR